MQLFKDGLYNDPFFAYRYLKKMFAIRLEIRGSLYNIFSFATFVKNVQLRLMQRKSKAKSYCIISSSFELKQLLFGIYTCSNYIKVKIQTILIVLDKEWTYMLHMIQVFRFVISLINLNFKSRIPYFESRMSFLSFCRQTCIFIYVEAVIDH